MLIPLIIGLGLLMVMSKKSTNGTSGAVTSATGTTSTTGTGAPSGIVGGGMLGDRGTAISIMALRIACLDPQMADTEKLFYTKLLLTDGGAGKSVLKGGPAVTAELLEAEAAKVGQKGYVRLAACLIAKAQAVRLGGFGVPIPDPMRPGDMTPTFNLGRFI